jgi:hypothetical protein
MRFEVLMAVGILIVVSWIVTPSSLVGDCQLLEEHAASIYSAEEYGDSMFLKMLAPIFKTAYCQHRTLQSEIRTCSVHKMCPSLPKQHTGI